MLSFQQNLEPGDLLVVGSDGMLSRSTEPYQTSVIGVYSIQSAVIDSTDMDMGPNVKMPVAILGIVQVKASAENGTIQPGDLLVSSATPGHAMKAASNPSFATIVGKTLEALREDRGVIKALIRLPLVSLQ